jgi:sensor domain CHASE-containing protein
VKSGGEDASRRGRGRPDLRAIAWSMVVLFVALGLWWFAAGAYRDSRLQLERDDASDHAEALASALRISMEMRAALTEGLAAFVADRELAGGLTREAFDTFAAGEYSVGSGIRTIQVAPGGVIRWTYPLKGSEAAIGLDLLDHPSEEIRTDARRAMNTKAMTVSGPYELAQGGLGVVLRKAIVVGGREWGLAAVVADVPRLLEEAGFQEGSEGARYAIVDGKGRLIAGDQAIIEDSPAQAWAHLPEGSWVVSVVPSEGWAGAVDGDAWVFQLQTARHRRAHHAHSLPAGLPPAPTDPARGRTHRGARSE